MSDGEQEHSVEPSRLARPRRSSREITEQAILATQRHARRHPPEEPRWRTMRPVERAGVFGVALALVFIVLLPLCDRAT